MNSDNNLEELCKLVRHNIITSTTEAGSGHASSALSGVELGTVLFFGGPPAGGFFRQDLKNPNSLENDRFILSKGHASPLLYSLYQAAGVVTRDELMKLRKFDSPLQGHPTPEFPYVDVTTGSLGQGLSVGLGMTLGLRRKFKNPPNVFVLLGDSEFAEGQIYEALQVASFYKTSNLIGILDVNRLGQSRETMLGWDLQTYEKRVSSFGWNTVVIEDGHNTDKVTEAYQKALAFKNERPTMVIAKTVKGRGITLFEDKDGWHGKPVPKNQLNDALKELGEVDLKLKGGIPLPKKHEAAIHLEGEGSEGNSLEKKDYEIGQEISTRQAYGDALALVGQINPNLISLDGEVSNSTFSEKFRVTFPDRYFEMFIAEQNMISVAVGLQAVGYVPFASTFASFLTRTFDQIRMARYSNANLKLIGSHSGVSMGQDGPSQMGLEDLAMTLVIPNSTVLVPSDAVSVSKLVEEMTKKEGIIYLRTMRSPTPVIYKQDEEFPIGGSKVLAESESDLAVVFVMGVTVHEALRAKKALSKENLSVAVVDLYSVKPMDAETVARLAKKSKKVIVVEDHYPYNGLGDAVLSALVEKNVQVDKYVHLCVAKPPRSGTPEELRAYEEIDAAAIVKAVKS